MKKRQKMRESKDSSRTVSLMAKKKNSKKFKSTKVDIPIVNNKKSESEEKRSDWGSGKSNQFSDELNLILTDIGTCRRWDNNVWEYVFFWYSILQNFQYFFIRNTVVIEKNLDCHRINPNSPTTKFWTFIYNFFYFKINFKK